MTFSVLPLSLACSFSTSALVGARIQSNRRRTVSGRMTFGYRSGCRDPGGGLQLLQIKLAISKCVSGDMVWALRQSFLGNPLKPVSDWELSIPPVVGYAVVIG